MGAEESRRDSLFTHKLSHNSDPSMEQINWRWRHFETMSAAAWHDILMLRADVFVVEQACPYKDPDHKDPLCWHLTGHQYHRKKQGSAVVGIKNKTLPGYKPFCLMENE